MGKKITLEDLLKGDTAEGKIKELSFEEGLKLLEELVSSVEDGTLSLEKSISSYERGVQLVGRLREVLSGAEEKLRMLKGEGGV